MGSSSENAVVGALVGYAASRTMDVATTWFYDRQSDASKRREEELAPGGALVQVGNQLGEVLGRDFDDEQAGRVGLAVHRALGMTYGAAATRLIKAGMPPLKAGLAVGTAAFILVDEGLAIADFTKYPVASHMRGVVGHAAYGLAAGALLALTHER